MKCVKCDKKAEIKVQNLNTCKNCFLEIIQKRVRKEIRINRLIEKNDKVLFIDDGSAEAKVSIYLFKRILKDLPVNTQTRKTNYGVGENIEGFDKVIVPWNADREDELFLKAIFEDKKPKYLSHFKIDKTRYVKMLLPVLSKEANLFADIKKIKYEDKKKKTYISKMLDELEEKYPSVKFGLLKSSQEIYNKN